MKKVAVQGYKGCFHEEAAQAFYEGLPLDIVECDTFVQLYDALDAVRPLIEDLTVLGEYRSAL